MESNLCSFCWHVTQITQIFTRKVPKKYRVNISQYLRELFIVPQISQIFNLLYCLLQFQTLSPY